MIIIPAIDLKDGKCVRLQQGEMDKDTVFSDKPPEMARKWESLGAQMLHLIDLNGAFSGIPENLAVIQKIRRAITIPIQLGGGIRTLETIETYLSLGIDRIILGTIAYQDSDFLKRACFTFPGRIAVGIDARNGKVAIKGWAEQTELSALDLARRCEEIGVIAIIYTDITRDGMLTGVNAEATRALAQAISIPVIASGGVATIDDIRKLLPLVADGIEGVIIGRALYAGTVKLDEALRLTNEGS